MNEFFTWKAFAEAGPTGEPKDLIEMVVGTNSNEIPAFLQANYPDVKVIAIAPRDLNGPRKNQDAESPDLLLPPNYLG